MKSTSILVRIFVILHMIFASLPRFVSLALQPSVEPSLSFAFFLIMTLHSPAHTCPNLRTSLLDSLQGDRQLARISV